MSSESSAKAQWIWIASAGQPRNTPEQYVDFHADVDLPEAPRNAVLRTSVESDLVAWLNGRLAGCGQFDDFPHQPTYSAFDVTALLSAGRNVLAITATHCGVGHFSYYPGEPGLWYELEVDGRVVAASGPRVLCRRAPCYLPGDTARITPQRGFTFNYDASKDDDWAGPAYRPDHAWFPAVAAVTRAAPTERPLPVLDVLPRAASVIVAQGLLQRLADPVGQTVGQQMQHDFLSAQRSWELFDGFAPVSAPAPWPVVIRAARLGGANGAYLVIDLGREECGHPALELNASDGDAVIDLAIGEHLDDLRVRAHVGGRNFACRYIARAGQQSFTHYLDRYAGRYLQLHITNLRGTLELRYAGLVPTEYPIKPAGELQSCDGLVNQIWKTARRTLHLCMFEHYEDCPWREQALYANDGRNQMLSGYYAFGNYDFARVNLELLARTTGDDGYQELCAPMRFDFTIPSFTMTWFLAVDDYLMHSGDTAFVARTFPLVKRMLQGYLAALSRGLLPCPTGKRYWHFYDWMPGLDGTLETDCATFDFIDCRRFDAPLNLLLVLALRAAANLAKYIGEEAFGSDCLRQSRQLAEAIHGAFWDEPQRGYRTSSEHRNDQPLSELVQSLAILAGVGADATRRELRRRLMGEANGMTPTTLSQSLYKFEAILDEVDEDDAGSAFVSNRILADWSRMLFAGATSFWETRQGGWDFRHAGSLCHGWSGIPTYFYSAYGLGIKPLEPGFRRFTVNPLLGLPQLRGTVPTPHGPLSVSLSRVDGVYDGKIGAPPGLVPAVDHPKVTIAQCVAGRDF